MKTELALISLLAIAGTFLFLNQSANSQDASDLALYQQWKLKHNQNTNGSEDAYRFAVFQQNLRYIEQHNAKNTKLTLGLNRFAAMTNEEYITQATSIITKYEDAPIDYSIKPVNDAPESFSWVQKGMVAPVQDQGKCGSCWAFSATSQLESLQAINNADHNLVKFSEQELVSCAKGFGCNGGNPLFAFNYSAKNGMETEESYPYVQANDPKTADCEYNEKLVVYKNQGGAQVPAKQPELMQAQLLKQPLSVSVAASSLAFQLYTSGVITEEDKCGTLVNHSVSLVGYNQEGDNNYWIVKNSWGTSWGQKGYVWIQNVEGTGVCGINTETDYPTKVNE